MTVRELGTEGGIEDEDDAAALQEALVHDYTI